MSILAVIPFSNSNTGIAVGMVMVRRTNIVTIVRYRYRHQQFCLVTKTGRCECVEIRWTCPSPDC